MPRYPYAHAMQAAISDEATALRQKQQAIAESNGTVGLPFADRRVPSATGTSDKGGDAASGTSARTTDEVIEALDQRIERLEQVREWIDEDPELAALIDKVIGKQVAAATKRQRVFNIFTNVALLIVGWLLSTFATPTSPAALLPK